MKTSKLTEWEDTQIEPNINNNLTVRAKHLEVDDIAGVVLNDSKFYVWSGSGVKSHHHYGTGMLLIHTREVVNLCFSNKDALSLDEVDDKTLFLGALFHDYGKCWDYEYHGDPSWNNWDKTDHCRLIHHISRSAVEWTRAVGDFPEYKSIEADVLHMILSHHGNRNYGSPVAPKTKEAWLLHLCDNMSARMDDCAKRDLF